MHSLENLEVGLTFLLIGIIVGFLMQNSRRFINGK